ncbi:MAG: LysR family transcriptional regulator [Lachnospiraceae bacterium]|nr:LysR family transcriptional regulator [Lachnospiraceae bacterium]
METARCKAFVASVKTGSFSGAAEQLNYTTSGVSQLVTALEKDLNLTLFRRSRKGVTLTADGERIYPVILNFLRQEERIYQTADEISGLFVGEISIAAYPSICASWLPDMMIRFQKLHPGVSFKINDDGVRRHIIEELHSGRADIGFMSDHHDLAGEWIELEKNPMLALVSLDSPYAQWESFPLKECQTATMIECVHGKNPDLSYIFADHRIEPNIVYTTLTSSTATAMASRNMGVFITNELSTHMWDFPVKGLPLDPPQYVALGMAVSPMSYGSPVVKAFVRFFRKEFNDSRDKSLRSVASDL